LVSAHRRLGRLTGETAYAALARRTALAFARELARTPRGLETLAAAVGEMVGAPEAGSPARDVVAGRVRQGPVSLSLSLEPERVAPGGAARVVVRLTAAEGAAVVAHRPSAAGTPGRDSADLVPLTLAFPGAPFPVRPPAYPPGSPVTLLGSAAPVLAHQGEVVVGSDLRVPRDASSGETRVRVRVVFQVCRDGWCGAPERALLEAPLVVDRPASAAR
jgi:hypothetical protein